VSADASLDYLNNFIPTTGESMTDEDKLNEIYNTVKDLHQTIRGFNGFEGLVSQVARIEEKQNSIEKTLTGLDDIKDNLNSIRTLTTVINQRGCAFGQTSGIHVPPLLRQENSDENVKWRELREKLFWPIVVALILACIYAIPQILHILSTH
jgi:hypothetical protein